MVGCLGGKAGGGLSTGLVLTDGTGFGGMMVQVCLGPIYSNSSLLTELIVTIYIHY